VSLTGTRPRGLGLHHRWQRHNKTRRRGWVRIPPCGGAEWELAWGFEGFVVRKGGEGINYWGKLEWVGARAVRCCLNWREEEGNHLRHFATSIIGPFLSRFNPDVGPRKPYEYRACGRPIFSFLFFWQQKLCLYVYRQKSYLHTYNKY
jgi:hypothetical protein